MRLSLSSLFTTLETETTLAAASDALSSGKTKDAIAELQSKLGQLTGRDSAHARILLGLALRERGKLTAAAEAFAAAATDDPSLSFYARWRAAELFFSAGHAKRAAAELAALPTMALTPSLAFLRAQIAEATGDLKSAETWYEQAKDAPSGPRQAAEIEMKLAEIAEARGADRDTIIAAYRRVMDIGADTRYGFRAERHLRELFAGSNGRRSASTYIARGRAALRAHRNRKSERLFAAALRAKGLTPELACEARYYRAQSTFEQRRYGRASRLFPSALSACRAVGNVDLEVKSAFQSGRSLYRAGRPAEAAVALEEAERHPQHSYVDDARILRAEALDAAGESERATELLRSTFQLYPHGDRVADARWRLAWRAYLAADYEAALTWLDSHDETATDEPYITTARAVYWTGRVHAARGDRARALASYRECVDRFPLGYYSLQALNRIRELDLAASQQLEASLAFKETEQAQDTEIDLSLRALILDPIVREATQLSRMGLEDEAISLLQGPGGAAVDGRRAARDAIQAERFWLTAYLLGRGEHHSRAVWITRWNLRSYRKRWPSQSDLTRWKIAYPRGYWQLVAPEAERNGYPVALSLAIMREESSFNPTLESWANAIGLMQLLVPTARRFARGTGFRISSRSLRQPRVNIRVGSRFLGNLWKNFNGRVGLLVPAYNAGASRVWRWMRDRYRPQLDEWIEAIPGDEARRYTKRVLGTYFAYSYLYGAGTVPDLGPDVPLELIPERMRETTDSPPLALGK